MLSRLKRKIEEAAQARAESSKANQARIQNERTYRARVLATLTDRHISDEEIATLAELRAKLAIPMIRAREIHGQVMQDFIAAAVADEHLTPEEIDVAGHAFKRLGVTWSQIHHSLTASYQRLHALAEIRMGQMPVLSWPTGIGKETADELLHFAIRAQVYEHKTVRTNYRGRSGGMSVRVMKGVSVRMGTSSGSAERDVRFVPIDDGIVFITNYRVIYAGTNLSHSVPWERIVSAEVFWDGLVLGLKGRSKNVQMKFPSPPPPGLLSAVMDHFLT